MKNTLSENMMRFGTKNLSEAAQKELVVKSIMETINQHGLQNVIRKKLTEATPNPNPDPKYLGYAQKILGQLLTALGGADDEDAVLRAIQSIPKYGGQPVYDNLLKLVKTSPNVKKQFGYYYNTVGSMIKAGGISWGGGAQYGRPFDHPLKDAGLGVTDQEYVDQIVAILTRYNDAETRNEMD